MAYRAKILHIVVLGIIGVTIVFYSSYSTGPVFLYHIKSNFQQNTTNGTSEMAASKHLTLHGPTQVTLSVTHETLINKTKMEENHVLDKTTQGITTEAIYESGYDIPNADLCPELGKRLKVVVGIMSAPSHKDARMAIRQTWGHYALRQDVSLAFIVGTSKEVQLNSITSEESTIYGDIIRGNFIDSYDNLTLKTISFMEWVDNYCSSSPFVLKTDDDMFINFPKLLSFIEKHWKSENTIFGRLARKWKPIRNKRSKYYVSVKQFSQPVFPDFNTGPAYLLTGDIINRLYKNALKSTYLKLEDVFTTGIVAQSLNIKRVHINEFINKRIPFNICNIKKSISIHMVKFHEQFDLWKKLLDGRSKCK
ncbi:beta-1,3-galactosyltransferase 5 isoform X2 [Halyomorpha halys]|uniref:beta-1,3-galactosyltransferase 5 isoform X2 n=1 Tax=Halyomorpha halys TaxID=286706 RepID=UPI0006D4DFBA|nr:beta-1,3-galactosyltransferase 5-like isoform X2 [Halyomorpha halys]